MLKLAILVGVVTASFSLHAQNIDRDFYLSFKMPVPFGAYNYAWIEGSKVVTLNADEQMDKLEQAIQGKSPLHCVIISDQRFTVKSLSSNTKYFVKVSPVPDQKKRGYWTGEIHDPRTQQAIATINCLPLNASAQTSPAALNFRSLQAALGPATIEPVQPTAGAVDVGQAVNLRASP